MKKFLTLLLVFSTLTMTKAQTVWEIIQNSADHNTLETAVELAGLEGALDAPGTLTVFAPTDDAFAALPSEVLDAVLADPNGLLTDILLYHVVGATALSTDLSDGQSITTLFGQDVVVTINMDGVFINNAQVIVADVIADNGVVHVIDAVLVPAAEETTVWDIIEGSADHNTLETAVLLAGLEGALQGAGPLTVFAPTDAAFAALPSEVLDAVLADPNGLLTDILLYHVVGAAALSTDLSDGQSITTLLGEDVVVTINMDGVFINNAQVIVADLIADNGVVHVIDAVLVPAAEETTVWDIIEGSADHNTLETAVLLAGLEGALQGAGPLTVFAPTDAAFAALPSEVLDAVLADPNGLLTDILLYHVVGATALSTDLSDGQSITTLLGEDVVVTINMDGVFINNAQVIVADVIADNGVVHVIDAVLVPAAEETTVWDIIEGSADHNTLETAVLLAGLEGALQGAGPLTVFAPTDAAFAALPSEVLDAVLADPNGLLTDILLYHVVGAAALSTDLSDGQSITTLLGEDVVVTINMDGVFINNAQVIVADVIADNGVVHVIDAVLVPAAEETTVWDIIEGSADHNTLETAVLLAGLEGALQGAGPLTVFAPTDAAFAALPSEVLDAVLADPNGLLTDILLYHVVGAAALSTDLSDGQSITTLFGQDVVVTINMDGVFINNAQVIVADVTADNGVVHIIDAVLIPNLEEDPCLEFEGGPYTDFNGIFGGAPVADANGDCPVNQITTFEAWASEQYTVNGFVAGVEYTFSICDGPGAGSWEPELSVIDSDGNLIAFEEGCEITWISPTSGTFLIGINEVGACGAASTNLGTNNGYPTLTCTGTSVTTVWDIIVNSPDHTVLETAVLAAGLEGALQGAGPLTVFAPTDAAFAALPAGLITELLADPSGALTDILLYHVVGSQALSTDLSDGQTIPTLFGESVLVTIDAGVFINTAEVIVADLLADNGVVHVIDAVLVPTTLSVSEADVAQVALFPNPASETVQLQLTNVSQNATYQIISTNGAIVQNGLLFPGMNTLQVNDLSSGLYLINILTEKGISAERLMVR